MHDEADFSPGTAPPRIEGPAGDAHSLNGFLRNSNFRSASCAQYALGLVEAKVD